MPPKAKKNPKTLHCKYPCAASHICGELIIDFNTMGENIWERMKRINANPPMKYMP